tara:strand:+ start:386 stop:595 length:210 start_codon:yes stop_codon:yes gene_type:complete
MKNFKEFQSQCEGIFDFLPKQKTKIKPSGVGIKDKNYRMPMPKQPTGGSNMRMPPSRLTAPNPYKVTQV